MAKKFVKRTDANNETLYFYTHSDVVDVGDGNATISLTNALNSKANTSDVQALSDDALRKSSQILSNQEKEQVHNNLSTESFIDDRAVRYDESQVLGSDEKAQALTNLGLNGVDDEPTPNSNNLVKSGGVEKELPVFHLIGNGNNIVYSSYFEVKAGNTYRVWVGNPSIDLTGVSHSTYTYKRFAIAAYDASKNKIGESSDYLVDIGCRDMMPLANFYDFIVPDNAKFVRILMRATANEVQTVFIEDISVTETPVNTEFCNEVSYKKLTYAILLNGNFGTSTSSFHAAIKVTHGERYIIRNAQSPSSPNELTRYAFATSDNIPERDAVDRSIPLVNGTSVTTVTRCSYQVVEIPESCEWLLVNFDNNDGYPLDVKGFMLTDDVPTTGSDKFIKSGKVSDALDAKVGYNDIDDKWKKVIKNIYDKDSDDIISGYAFLSGDFYETENGVISHKIRLKDGQSYSIQNVVMNTFDYNNPKIIYGLFDNEDNLITTKSFIGTLDDPSAQSGSTYIRFYGHGTFIYKNEGEAYIRFMIQGTRSMGRLDKVQIELGDECTEVVPYRKEERLDLSDLENNVSDVDERTGNIETELGKETVIVRNILDKDRFLTGKYYGVSSENTATNGIASHNLYLRDGEMYSISNCCVNVYNDNAGIIVATFKNNGTDEGQRLGGYKIPVDANNYTEVETSQSQSSNANRYYGFTTFVYHKGEEDFVRITIQGAVNLMQDGIENVVQLELGDNVTQYAEYNAITKDIYTDYEQIKKDVEALKNDVKKMNILAIGNSNSQDSLSYVPFLMHNIAPEVELEIHILMLSSSDFSDHIENFDNAMDEGAEHTSYDKSGVKMWYDGKSYIHHSCKSGDSAWTTVGNSSTGVGLVSIQEGLDLKNWDVILFNATSLYSTTKPLFGRIVNYLTYPAKIGIINPAISAVHSNGKMYSGEGDETHGRPFAEGVTGDTGTDTLNGRWYNQLNGAKAVMEQTICDVMFPINAAICNALTVEEIKKCGDLSKHVNNRNYIDENDHTLGCYGYLRAPDGVHLQEGLPCQIAAYAVIYKLFDVLGMRYRSVIGDTTICNRAWITGKSLPGPHPDESSGPSYTKQYTSVDVAAYSVTGWIGDETTDKNRAKYAQMCAVIANKYPYSITDMNDVIDVETAGLVPEEESE